MLEGRIAAYEERQDESWIQRGEGSRGWCLARDDVYM